MVKRVLIGAAIVSASFLIGKRIPDAAFVQALAAVAAFAGAIPERRDRRRRD